MKITILLVMIMLSASCNGNEPTPAGPAQVANMESSDAKVIHYRGAISNGMKGDSLSFDLSADRKKLSNLTFNGYWRCSGKLERERAAGPDGSFDVVNGKVDGHISEPPGGGSTAWRFDLNAAINDKTATGTFRMNINNLGCDTYLLKFEAVAVK